MNSLLPILLLTLAGRVLAADAPTPTEFAWRATLELPPGVSVARVALPALALQRLQSSDARDLRVFNASGEPVAFAITRPNAGSAAVPVFTPSYAAFPLFATTNGAAPGTGAVQVRIEEPAGQRSVWVQLDSAAKAANTAGALTPVQAALFATRDEKRPLAAITIQAELPANVPVRVDVATSTDLAQWSPVALRGRIYRFEGSGAPGNMTLEFEQPLQLEGRYLRLGWYGQDGVRVSALTGTVAQALAPTAREHAALGVPKQTGKDTLDWTLDFATPLAALALATPRANTLMPVRVLGRNDAAQPWRELGQTVIYRLGSAGAETSNPPLQLPGVSVRQLRVVAGNGLALDGASLQAGAEFEPVQVVFLATGAGPFALVAGRANTPVAALGNAVLGTVVAGKLDALPLARIASVVQAATGSEASLLDRLVGGVGGRSLVLWAVLVAGVVLLAAVAFALLRQLKAAPAGDGNPPGAA